MSTLFVTGTDTGVGKTLVACALLRRARGRGVRACGYKPVASGCVRTAEGLRNEDALGLLAESAPGPAYADVNPLALEPPIAPHIAAARAGTAIDLSVLDRAYERLAAAHDCVIVEGAGGWRVPLSARHGFDDWVAARRWPVVLVVGMRLGCINHALLSAESIGRRAPLAGWVANLLPPEQPYWQDNVEALRERLPAPLWGVVPCGAHIETAADALSGAPW
ncbi:MAG: dethiobiotin synthase [Gammaproteobacteria bacterium]